MTITKRKMARTLPAARCPVMGDEPSFCPMPRPAPLARGQVQFSSTRPRAVTGGPRAPRGRGPNTATTLHKPRPQIPRQPISSCHQGAGTIQWLGVLGPEDLQGKHLHFFHHDLLPPGSSIGPHRHEDDEEYYYVVSGHGLMTLDDRQADVGPGDITAVFPGGRHALENNGNRDLRIILASISERRPDS